jgi:hypothetical protein
MDATQVVPKRWQLDESYAIKVLYDDGEYSVIWGKYDNVRALGTRWNGEGDNGYPSLFGNPMWFVEPDFIAIAILQRLQTMAIDITQSNRIAQQNNGLMNESIQYYHLTDIEFAITELSNKMRSK